MPKSELRDQDELRSLVLSYSNLTPVGVKMVCAARDERRYAKRSANARIAKRAEQLARLERVCQ